jgi:glycosyltransferase involved in cell wall biosynthesis
MTATEAAACGTPAVVSCIAGHVDAVRDGVSGLVADVATGAARVSRPGPDPFADALGAVLTDPALRARLGQGARARAEEMTWEATAARTLDALVEEALSRKRPGSPRRRDRS